MYWSGLVTQTYRGKVLAHKRHREYLNKELALQRCKQKYLANERKYHTCIDTDITTIYWQSGQATTPCSGPYVPTDDSWIPITFISGCELYKCCKFLVINKVVNYTNVVRF